MQGNDGERWWDSSSFQSQDMPALGRLAEDVHAWIDQQAQRLNQADGEDSIEGTS